MQLDHLRAEAAACLGPLADHQESIVLRGQLAAELTQSEVEAQVAARRWQALGSTVIALHNGELTQRQSWWAAVLAAEGPSALAGRTAAEAHGLLGWEAEAVHVVIQRGAKVNRVPGVHVKVHESRRFTGEDIHESKSPPMVTVERALIDAAAWSRSPRTACGLLAAGVQQRLTTAERLTEMLASVGRVRHRRLLGRVLMDIAGGAQAVSEVDFLRFCARHGMPRPTLQVRRDVNGRRRYLDAVFRRADGQTVRVEIDGAAHLVVSTYWSDMVRHNDFTLHREPLLRFPSAYIHAADPVAVAQLRAALGLSATCQNVVGL